MTSLNLITDAWLPIVRQSGVEEIIRPAQIVDQFDADPVVAFNWGRPDYDSASREFVIGLLATACPPVDGKSWRAWWTKPPSVKQLDAAFAKFAPAFNLDGKGPLFMQDFDPLNDQPVKDIGLLPLESCGNITIAENADLFQKRHDVPRLSRRGAAIVLLTNQLYAGFGGVGHRVALRGRGPVVTLVAARGEPSLWRLLWLNTPQQMDKDASADLFPWMSPSRLSPNDEVTTPQQVSLLTQFWGTPTRLRLVFSPNADGLACPIAGDVDDTIVTGFKVQNYGACYGSVWSHVLTPHYFVEKTGEWLPVHGSEDVGVYVRWPTFAGEPTPARRPAEIVSIAEKRLLAVGLGGESVLSLFTIDMENTKARGSYELISPLFVLPDEYAQVFHRAVEQLVDGSGLVASFTRSAIRDATVGEQGDVNKGQLAGLRRHFYSDTEAAFYELLRSLSAALTEATGDPTPIIQQHAAQWLKELRREALMLFDEMAPLIDQRASRAEVGAAARLSLAMAVSGIGSGGGAKVLRSLGLPLPEKPEKKTAHKKAA